LRTTPNPSKGIFTLLLQASHPIVVPVEVYNSRGAKLIVSSKQIQKGLSQQMIDLRSLPAGIYFLRLGNSIVTEVTKIN
jgi:hypothetical protein